MPVTSVYSDYQTDPNSSGGAPSVCSVAGWVVGRYHNDAGCKDAEPLPKVCWTQKSGSTDCDSMRPGFLVNTDNGIDLCKVGSSSGEMDFFFDNHCEHGNLAWNAKKSGKIPGAEKIDETSRMKPIVVEPICDAGLLSGACDDEQAKTEGQGPPPKRVVPTKPVRTKPSVKKAGSGG